MTYFHNLKPLVLDLIQQLQLMLVISSYNQILVKALLVPMEANPYQLQHQHHMRYIELAVPRNVDVIEAYLKWRAFQNLRGTQQQTTDEIQPDVMMTMTLMLAMQTMISATPQQYKVLTAMMPSPPLPLYHPPPPVEEGQMHQQTVLAVLQVAV
jgi:hypothetical protein